MEPELESLDQQFRAIRQDADQLIAGLNNDQLSWRARPGSWSIAECLAHIAKIHEIEIGTLRGVIEEGRKKGILGKPPFKYSWVSRWFVRSMEPPVKQKFKVPKVYVSPPGPDPQKAIEDFRKTIPDMQEVVKNSSGLDLGKIKAPSAVTRLLRMNLGVRIALFAAHDRRHLWQAWNVRKDPSFPK